jgi:hypothetical protein
MTYLYIEIFMCLKETWKKGAHNMKGIKKLFISTRAS